MTRSNLEPLRLLGLAGLVVLLAAPIALARAQRTAQPAPLLPGLLQAEAFDDGGEGVGFHVATENDAVAAAPKTAKAAPRLQSIPGGGQAVELRKGDWLRYSVTVEQSGRYRLVFRVAHDVGTDPLFLLESDGKDVTGTMNAPYTGGLARWVTIERPMVSLEAGSHVLTLRQTGGTAFSVDSIAVEPGGPVAPGPAPDPASWRLSWSDEFEADGAPDPATWDYDRGGHGWGNNELQFYTDRRDNSRVENGRLVIEARKEEFEQNHYTSARLVTRGKRELTYGRVEVSARLPVGRGSWPAIWMLGSAHGKTGWPDCGEIDIMEHLGRNLGWIHGSTHSKQNYFKNGNQLTSITYVPEPDRAFHVYSVEWSHDRIDFFVDHNKYLTVANDGSGHDAWPFDEPEYLILNVALGGWGGEVVDAELPARMEVDWVRVYERKAPR